MPALIGYMLAIVMIFGGYLAGLHWLVNPPDPWQSSAKVQTSKVQTRTAQHVAARKQLPAGVSADANAASEPPASTELAASMEPNTQIGPAESAGGQTSEPETMQSTQQDVKEATRPAAEPERIRRHEAAKAKSDTRKRIASGGDGQTNRKLKLMVLRTYERSDGKRFTRLLPMDSARNAFALQPDDAW